MSLTRFKHLVGLNSQDKKFKTQYTFSHIKTNLKILIIIILVLFHHKRSQTVRY